jgi:hypothetical protein
MEGPLDPSERTKDQERVSKRPPSFAVTAAGGTVTLDDSGAASASFTVTNTTPQTVTGKLLTHPTDPARPEWFSIVGESIRDFTPNAVQDVVVQLNVPPGSPPATYAFRLDAVAEDDPDEDYTEGPSVAFVVAAPPTAPKKKFPWWILIVAGAVVLVIVIGVVVWLLTKGDGGTTQRDACVKGYVWREAVPNDHVCVTPAVQQQTRQDNALADSRRNPNGGPYGPDTCLVGYVWREAVANDHVCVTGATREQARSDNAAADSRRAG